MWPIDGGQGSEVLWLVASALLPMVSGQLLVANILKVVAIRQAENTHAGDLMPLRVGLVSTLTTLYKRPNRPRYKS